MSKSARVLNISPKVQLQINDDRQGAYPTILRSDDQRTLGNDPSVFHDTTTQAFVDQDVLMPYNVTGSLAKASGFLTGTISIFKTPSPASQFLTRFEEDTFKPYNETRNPASFYETGSVEYVGFDEALYQGFTSPIPSKTAIEIDISTPSSRTITVAISKGIESSSPFVYYNFEDKDWDQIGITDPATGDPTNYVHALDGGTQTIGGSDYLTASNGTEKIVKQFTSSPGVASSISFLSLKELGYDRIGYPTSMFGAPNAPRYHAKKSQSIKLSNFIQHPFILERIQVELPIEGTRKQTIPLSPPARGFGRDIDNHVFFLYRQNRTGAIVDSVTDVSSSIRSLIANESFCFYNRPTMPLSILRATPIHENQLESNYNMASNQAGTVTRSFPNFKMNFTPKTYEQQYTNSSVIGFIINKNSSPTWTVSYTQNFWAGGNKTQEFPVPDFELRRADPPIRSIQDQDGAEILKNSMLRTEITYDPRALRSSLFGSSVGDRVTNTEYFKYATTTDYYPVTTKNLGYRKNLYLLLPEDELVFGIDAGFFPTFQAAGATVLSPSDLPVGYTDTPATDTTGNLKILAGKARVILYGTMIKDGIEKLGSINQGLTSCALHEDVHEIIVDQHQVNERLSYSGSYIDNYITGTMGDPTNPRQVVHTATSGLAGDNFALEKFVTMQNFSFNYQDYSLDPTTFSLLGPTAAIKKRTTKNPVATFRHDRYGQFRDMLEQRIDSKGRETVYKSRNFPIPDFIKTFGSSSYSSPVVAIYTSQSSEIVVDPLNTRICNLSTESTASLPYFDDGVARNRSPIVFNENPPFKVETVILDKPSTLLSTS